MNKFLAAGAAVLFSLMAAANGSVGAQTIQPPQDAFLESIQASIVRTVGAQDKTVELSIVDNVFTVSRINSNMNESTHGGRNNEASAIGSVVSKAIVGKSEFQNIITIRVQYVTRYGSTTNIKVIDTVEFRKDPNGAFQFHTT